MSNILREKLNEIKSDFGMHTKVPCTQEEADYYNQILNSGGFLPENIHCVQYEYFNNNKTEPEIIRNFYKFLDSGLSEKEVPEYLTYKKLSLLKTSKNCLVLCSIISCISLVVSVATFIATLNML